MTDFIQPDSAFWRGKRVLLTGHTGFKGSWMSLWLQNLGADVCGLSLCPPTEPSLFEVSKVAQGMTHATGDIRDYATVLMQMQSFKPEIVFHMAAQPLVRLSYQQPVETYSTNVMGTVHVLEAARYSGSVKALVNITTDKCYDNREWAWGYREDEPMGGHDPYSSSKGCAELVTTAYRNSFFNVAAYDDHQTALATARAGNVIGGGDWADAGECFAACADAGGCWDGGAPAGGFECDLSHCGSGDPGFVRYGMPESADEAGGAGASAGRALIYCLRWCLLRSQGSSKQTPH